MRKIVILGLALLFLVGCQSEYEIFALDDQYYNNNSINEIDSDGLNDLLESNESFAVFIYQPLCVASSNFENVLNEFLEEYQISFYKVSFSDMKETELSRDIKYFPSFAVFDEGKLVQSLDANSDDDTVYYESLDGFVQWFSEFVLINENES